MPVVDVGAGFEVVCLEMVRRADGSVEFFDGDEELTEAEYVERGGVL